MAINPQAVADTIYVSRKLHGGFWLYQSRIGGKTYEARSYLAALVPAIEWANNHTPGYRVVREWETS